MSDWRDRLIHKRDELGLTNAELARRAGIKPTMLHDILERGTTPSVENLFKISRALHFTLSELYEGTVTSVTHRVKITGECEGAAVVDSKSGTQPDDVVVTLPTDGVESIRIVGDLFEASGYRRGDVICGVKHPPTAANSLVGKDCIIATLDGTRMIAHPVKQTGPSAYNLRFLHRSQPDREHVQLAWAAPITMIVRE